MHPECKPGAAYRTLVEALQLDPREGNTGEVQGLAEVVRDGHERQQRLALGQGSQSASATGERALYLQARKLLAEEIALARGLHAVEADEWIVDQVEARAKT